MNRTFSSITDVVSHGIGRSPLPIGLAVRDASGQFCQDSIRVEPSNTPSPSRFAGPSLSPLGRGSFRSLAPTGRGLRSLGELGDRARSEEHTSELQSLMSSSYAVFCLKK